MTTSPANWHRRLYLAYYWYFDRTPRRETSPLSYAAVVAGAALFLACGVIIFLGLNVLTLLVGMYAEPIWQPRARFRHIMLPGRVPMIAVAAPVLLAIGAYANWRDRGLALTIGPFLFTAGLGLLLLGVVVVANRLSGRMPRVIVEDIASEDAGIASKAD